jgi:hypothetical protein
VRSLLRPAAAPAPVPEPVRPDVAVKPAPTVREEVAPPTQPAARIAERNAQPVSRGSSTSRPAADRRQVRPSSRPAGRTAGTRPPTPIESEEPAEGPTIAAPQSPDWVKGPSVPQTSERQGGPERTQAIPLAEEQSLLEQARELEKTGAYQRALSVLDEYSRRAPNGQLRDDATPIRVDILLKTGERGAAVAVAREYLAREPFGTYASHFRKLIETDTNP